MYLSLFLREEMEVGASRSHKFGTKYVNTIDRYVGSQEILLPEVDKEMSTGMEG
jgi:hypothetical protein